MSHISISRNTNSNQSFNTALFIVLQNCLNSISTDKPMKEIRNDIFSFAQRLGAQGQKFVISSLMQSLQQNEFKDKTTSSYKSSLLSQLIKEYSTNDSFSSYFPEIIAKVGKQNKLNQYVNTLLTNLKLPLNTQIAIFLSFYLSDRPQLVSYGQTQLIAKIRQYSNSDKPTKLPEKLMDQLLFQININPELSTKLEAESKLLSQNAEKLYKSSEVRIYNYYKRQWQFFANQTPVIEKPIPILLKKSDVLKDLGPFITNQTQSLKAVSLEIGQFNEEDIFQCLMMMAEQKTRIDSGLDKFVIDLLCASSSNNNKKNSKGQQLKKVFSSDVNHKKNNINWNIDNFLQYCMQNIQNIKWQNILANFDREKLTFSSDDHFAQMMKIFQKIKKLIKKWSLNDSILLKKWVHAQSQSQFLLHLFNCKDSQSLFFVQNQTKKNQNQIKQSNALKQLWNYPQLVTLLFEVAGHKRQRMKQIFDSHIEKYPDIIIRTLSEINPNQNQQLVNQVFSQLLPQFLENEPRCIKVLQSVWRNNQQLLIKTLNNLCKQNKDNHINLNKLVQIFSGIQGVLDQMVKHFDSNLSLSIILIGGKKQVTNLQRWLAQRMQKNQNKCCKQIVHYLENNLLKHLRTSSNQMEHKQTLLQQANLSIETLNKIFSVIVQKLKQDHPTSKNNQLFKKIHKQCCKFFPEVAQGQIYEQVEKQCEQQIKKIYKGQITIKDAIQNLKSLKNSNKKQERQNFANKITFLCIQLVYHHSYPQKQLMTTADLFSQLINQNLVQKKIFQIFLHVLEAYLKQDNPQWAFAVRIVQNIKQKIAHQSWFCQKLIQYDLLIRKEPELVDSIIKSVSPPIVLSVQNERKIKQSIKMKNAALQGVSRHIIIQPEVHHTENIQSKHEIIQYDILATLDKIKKIQFPEKQNKIRLINTICNTLSAQNVEQKSKELKKAMDSQKSILLLAHNIIFKRIAVSNISNIQLIFKLIDNIPKAEKPILNITLKILSKWFSLEGKSMNNDKKITNFKNLGSWLGRITLGKGFPIPIYKLNIKDILKKTYQQKQRIGFNVPVILKIMEYITYHPQIFRQQSPWLKRILCALNQLQTNLKEESHVKSEIKAFFKLSKMNMQIVLDNQLAILSSNEKQQSILQIIHKKILSEQLLKFCEALEIKNIKPVIARILQSSIEQIVSHVIDRASSIAKISATHLISKDFATEPGVQKFRQSSVSFTKQLAKPLALITCRQPLKGSLTKNTKNYFKQNSQHKKLKQQQLDALIQKIILETLDLGCEIIKQRASKQAENRVKDQKFIANIEGRNQAKRAGLNYRDQIYLSNIPSIVPMQLRPSPNGLSQQEYLIYSQMRKSKSKQISKKMGNQQSYQQSLIALIQLKQPIQKIKKCLNEHSITEQILLKIYTYLLDQNNDESDIEYYIAIIKQMKDLAASPLCWKVFKQVIDIKNNDHHRKILKRLIRQNYFDESVLAQLMIEEQKLLNIFDKWIKISPTINLEIPYTPNIINNPLNQQVVQFLKEMPKQLMSLECNLGAFIHTCLKYITNQILQDSQQNQNLYTLCYNMQYIAHFQYFLVCYYYNSGGSIKDIESKKLAITNAIDQLLDGLFQSIIKLSSAYSTTNHQRAFFKIIVNLIEIISYQRQKQIQQVKQTKQAKQTKQTKQAKQAKQIGKQAEKPEKVEKPCRVQFSRQKIIIFHKVLAKRLCKLNPNIKPQFAFAWLEILCNKHLIRNLLQTNQNGQLYFNLLCHLFKFMSENITEQKLYMTDYCQAYQCFYRAVFKLVIVLLHDFSCFLSQYSLELCLLVDSRFMQLKNIINSVYPVKQLIIPLKFDRREDLEQFVQKVGYPKYKKISFDKKKLNYYLTNDPNDNSFREKLLQQEDLFLQTLVLYISWLQQNGLTQAQAIKKLTDILVACKQEMRLKLVNYLINLIRYPNYVTLFLIDFVDHIVLKQNKHHSLRQLILQNFIIRMRGEVPLAWGLIYLYNNFASMKKTLSQLSVSQQILDQL